MKTFYEVNGRKFESKDEAIKYEEGLEKERIKREKIEKEKRNRLEQIEIKGRELNELKEKFEKDYDCSIDVNVAIKPSWFPLDSWGNFRYIYK